MDLRTAEVEFNHQKGVFTANLDSLLLFLKTAPKKEVLKEGSLTDKQLEAGLTEPKAVKILDAAKKKALKNKKLTFENNDALYAYIWENDADVKKNGLSGFRRDTIEQNMIQSLYKGRYDESTIDGIVLIPFSDGQRFEIEVNNDYKTSQGIRVPIFEARAPFGTYLGDLNEQELVNLADVLGVRKQEAYHGVFIVLALLRLHLLCHVAPPPPIVPIASPPVVPGCPRGVPCEASARQGFPLIPFPF